MHLKLLNTKETRRCKKYIGKNTCENLNHIYFNMKRLILNALFEKGPVAMELEKKKTQRFEVY